MTSSLRSAAPLARLTALVVTAVVAWSAHAQTPPAPAAAPAANVAVPAMDCVNPGNAPLERASPAMGRFQKKVEDYKVCVNTYTASIGGKANEYAAMSRAYSDAANKAIDDYNTYVTNLNESTKSTRSGAQKNTD